MTTNADEAWAHWIDQVPTPADPPPAVDWAATQQRLGTRLPTDYRRYVDRYGLGCVNQLVWVLHPDGTPDELNLGQQWAAERDQPADDRLLTPPPHPPGRLAAGLLPCAVDEDAGVLYWHTGSADPDRWTVLYRDEDGGAWLPYRMSLVPFLLALFTGGLPELGFGTAGFVGPSIRFDRTPFG